MEDDELLDKFLDATFDDDEVDHDTFLSEGGEDVAEVVRIHQLFQAASKSWKEPRRPTQLDRFQVVGDLGAGGIGKVYLGWDPELHRHVAIKVISRDRWASNEARSIAKLDHRSIVKVYEVGRDHLVMELLDGGTLQDKIQDILAGNENNMSSLRARLHCLVRIAEGLAFCHERGILHRDVKPSNILFARDDEHPRLCDFGLAHLDELESLDITQNLVGSPAYLSPEQVESGETGTDHRSDIFSFGSLAYELLTLTSPFKRETRQETMDAVADARTADPRKLNPEISKSIANILVHCLEPDPRQRYASMREVALDIQDALANRPISVGSRSPLHLARLFMKRHRRASAFAGLGIAVATLASFGIWARSLHGERSLFLEEISRLNQDISAAQSGHELNDLGFSLLNAKNHAENLDRSPLGSLVLRTAPRASEAIELWSRRIATRLSKIANFETGKYPSAIWRGVLILDHRMQRDAPWNAEAWNRGRVTLSEELANNESLVFYKEGPVAMTGFDVMNRTFEQVPFSEFPDAGFYRIELPGTWQREFLVSSTWCDPIHLEVVHPTLDTSNWTHLEELGVLISPLISSGEVAELGLGGDFGDHGPDEPFRGPMIKAQKYADMVGGRLPTGIELDLFFSEYEEPELGDMIGENITDGSMQWELNKSAHYDYRSKIEDPTRHLVNLTHGVLRHVQSPMARDRATKHAGGHGFRVVYLAPPHQGGGSSINPSKGD